MTNQPRFPLAPLATIGILGGGQLGRMLAVAAAELGFRTHIFCPEPDSPAFDAAHGRTVAAYDDLAALDGFAGAIDVATYEFENVPLAAARRLADKVALRPGLDPLGTSQDRLTEKDFVVRMGAQTAPYWPINNPDDLDKLAFDRPRYVLKTCRLGYDGKGQEIVASRLEAAEAFARLGSVPAILEAFVAFSQEVSVVLARSESGQIRSYEIGQNSHQNQMLAQTLVPAPLSNATRKSAIDIAQRIANGLDYIGVMGVEFFVVPVPGQADRLLVNEFAPRVHNSGHWTQDGAPTCQFTQHIRAIAGWPLGPVAPAARCVMTNLVGDDINGWHDLAAQPDCHPHFYGKRESRPGRKMGHVTRILKTQAD